MYRMYCAVLNVKCSAVQCSVQRVKLTQPLSLLSERTHQTSTARRHRSSLSKSPNLPSQSSQVTKPPYSLANHPTSPHGLAKSPNLHIYIGTWKLLQMQANTFSLLLSMASLVYRAWLSSYFICCSLALWGLQTLVQVYLVSFNNASKRIVLVPQTSL